MKHEQLIEAVAKIRSSSAWTPGDPTTFAVTFLRHEAELSAPSSPYAYFSLLKAKLSLPDFAAEHRVAVYCAGFGGLASAALDLGVKEVVSIEPRARFRAGLEAVTGLLDQVYADLDASADKDQPKKHRARAFHGWPTGGHIQSLGKFDLIVWPEGFDECVDPMDALATAFKLLGAKGTLVVEVKHGENATVPTGRINSWLPTVEAFEKLLVAVNGKGSIAAVAGRATNRTIYIVPVHAPKFSDELERPSAQTQLPPFPRDPSLKTVHRVGSNLATPPTEVATSVTSQANLSAETRAVAAAATPPIIDLKPVYSSVDADIPDDPVVILDLDEDEKVEERLPEKLKGKTNGKAKAKKGGAPASTSAPLTEPKASS